jgi:hypothetical protein
MLTAGWERWTAVAALDNEPASTVATKDLSQSVWRSDMYLISE